MELSKLSVPFKCSKNKCLFSPNGKLIAISHQLKLLIRSADNFSLIKMFDCDGPVDHIEWAADSQFIMCASYSPRAFVHVFCLQNTSFQCKISEGAPGLILACWSPDSRHILTISVLHIQLSIWSLTQESVQYVHHLKKGSPGLAFSPDGEYLALLEQRGAKEYILVLQTHDWAPALRVECRGIWHACGLAWSPDSSGVCTWSSPPSEGLQVFWLSGETSQKPLTSGEEPATLGVRCIAWSPTGQFLAFGANDSQVHLINTITWKPIAQFHHHHHITAKGCTVYEECSPLTKGSVPEYAVVERRPTRVVVETFASLGPKPAHRPQGIKHLAFCPSGAWIASQEDSCPHALWIWSIASLRLHSVLLHKQPLSDSQWSPVGDGTLAICASPGHVSLWSPTGGAFVVQSHLSVTSQVAWHPRGTRLLLKGTGECCLLEIH